MSSAPLPLFPLPNVVHFPSTELRLHIFEPRYRRLIEDLRRRPEVDRLIGMVLLKPGWQDSNEEAPPIYQSGTAGQLVKIDYLEDGRSNIVLRGRYRFQVEREFPSHPYRQALVSTLEDQRLVDQMPDARELREEIALLLSSLGRRTGRRTVGESRRDVASSRKRRVGLDASAAQSTPLDELVNTIAAGLDIPVENKLDLLTEELPERASRVLSILRSRERVMNLLDPFRHLGGTPDLN